MDPKDRILLKAEELFMQFGIRSVSMDDIANNLGMSKKTLYQYFADKDELVEAVVDGHINGIQDDCLDCRKEASNAIHEIFNTMERIMEEFSNMNPMLLYDLEKFHHKAYQRFRDHKDKFLLQVIIENIEWGIKDDLYRSDINIDVMSKYRIESMMIPFNVTVFSPGKYNLAETSGLIIENFIYGLATIKGHKLIQKYNEQRQKNLSYEESKK
ncbi:MAG: TetR/AcrR family transcriptional regulator [Chitinophagaceae bacterium]|nr:TetR/AcrR family transcriptional regulator [Chitinophagaceae bacterium]MBK8608321.1 TetR/AcrR family transcriptional regulator [Chitinophagaceae bacterium]MBP6477979.1 TetR/AcrR family transcriptional regulator [Chitinophagaceae bacterium]MBP7315048.1 TetR/AcrR family transcriptional regulator [Chitinophagaceae bacterium]HQV56137.1 TetR/AcrR family transcriptional regulator [Chitinophagaceae bacterium]